MQLNHRALALFVGGLLAAVAPALATNVDFSTTGQFGSTGTNTLSGTNVAVTFNGVTNTEISTPGQESLGMFQVSFNDPGSDASLTPAAGETFSLNIAQISPAGSGSFSNEAFSGTVSQTQPNFPTGQLILTFDQTSITVSGVTYTLLDLGQGNLASNQLGIGTSDTTVEALVGTPEPASYALAASGLVGLLFGAIRRKKQTV